MISAFATLYFQYFERRRVAVVPGDWIDLSYGQIADGGGYSDLDAILSLSLVNRGAIDALVTAITATVRPERDGSQIECRWASVYEPVEEVAPNKSRTRYWKLKGWAHPLAAPGRTVVTNWFRLYSPPIPSALPVGSYVLEIEATETRPAGRRSRRARGDTERRVLARWAGGFELDEKDARYLKTDCVEGTETLTDCVEGTDRDTDGYVAASRIGLDRTVCLSTSHSSSQPRDRVAPVAAEGDSRTLRMLGALNDNMKMRLKQPGFRNHHLRAASSHAAESV